MASKKDNPKTETADQGTAEAAPVSKQGAAIILESGERRIDYIRRRFYDEGAKRGEIAKELGVPYQIVFAATKAKPEGAGAGESAAADAQSA